MPEKQYTQTRDNDILIVDDEASNLQLLSELLTREGYQVRPANSSQLAIDSALIQPPKLILLDVKMPEMDGFEVCQYLKQDDRTREIPILFVSALKDVKDKVRGFEAGGVDFISKPFQEEEILARVRTHVDLRNMQLNLEEIVAERTAELTKSESKYRSLVENSMVGIFVTTLDGRFEFVNDALSRMFDFDSPEQMIVQGALGHWKDLKARDRLMARLQKHGSVINFEAKTVTHKDQNIHTILSAKLLGDNIFGMVMDITERKQLENKIIGYQNRLKALACEVTLSEEMIRRTVATNLHDHIGQSIALARLQIGSARQLTCEARLKDKLDDISDTLLKAFEDTQTLMFELGSHSIHETGLSSAVSEWMESEIQNRHHMKIQVIDNIPENRRKTLAPNIRTILFRNVRELIVNVVKHARANRVSVRFEAEESTIKAIIEDDGIGFDPQERSQVENSVGGFGLFSIQELMADLDGDLSIVSAPGKGCTAILTAPFNSGDNQRRT